MRRVLLVLALIFGLMAPASVAAQSDRCSLEITPTAGSSTDVFRIRVWNVPVDPDGGSVEARIDIRRLGSREGSIIFAFLVPGVTEFYVDYNFAFPEEPPPDPLIPGRYHVRVTTPHLSGADACHVVGQFQVA